MTVPLPPDFWEAGPVLPFPALFFEPMEERMEELQIVYLSPHDLTPYENNARKHTDTDVEQIAESIRVDGFNDPIGIWGDNNLIVEGHGRQIAAIELGLDKVPCIRLDHMTDAQRRDYAIRHNRTAELSAWDDMKLEMEVAALELEGFDFSGLEWPKEEQEQAEQSSVAFHEKLQIIIDFQDEDEAETLYNRLTDEGYTCRISTL